MIKVADRDVELTTMNNSTMLIICISFSWSSINCSTEFMSANLEAMFLGKQEMLQTFTLNYLT